MITEVRENFNKTYNAGCLTTIVYVVRQPIDIYHATR
ncbi:hypothetical protein SAMN04515679_4370 [Pelosinus fermentans]|uniref:Uncharacterized protein n=1 Tax=Pelosinus fermentans B4 TaxID=1149862 RepID=I9LFP0_9FIRM|nr:hypothetical protein FB4_2906 [Pelosinus fermentans B4]EIW25072.1 hypothetical protein FA11_2932 [Pelosinus fermentans A11]OAM96177.1 hypothetical protein FR7_04199 [Pelosinus fermentans DSM 17108]SDR37196.1 hypothetical protein SAMN04515679_4370 [Pelosinus fermentans]